MNHDEDRTKFDLVLVGDERRDAELVAAAIRGENTQTSTLGGRKSEGQQMWLFTPEGFYSVVTAEEFGHPLQVRARCDDDLDRLRSSYFPKLGENVHIPGRDYPVRAFMTHEDFAECLGRIAQAIDYDNFKSTVAARHSSQRAHVYGKVWSDCRRIEQEEEKDGTPQ